MRLLEKKPSCSLSQKYRLLIAPILPKDQPEVFDRPPVVRHRNALREYFERPRNIRVVLRPMPTFVAILMAQRYP